MLNRATRMEQKSERGGMTQKTYSVSETATQGVLPSQNVALLPSAIVEEPSREREINMCAGPNLWSGACQAETRQKSHSQATVY